jgi:hypothetical protein
VDEYLQEMLTTGKSAPLWAVLQEDTYETSLGDGYYAYLAALFRSEPEAVRFVQEQSHEWRRWHVRQYEISCDRGGKLIILPGPTRGEAVTVEEVLNLARSAK